MKKIIIFSSIFILIDQIIKLIVRTTIIGIEKVIIPKFLYLEGVKNTGGAFSIFSNNTILFILIAVIILIYIFNYLKNRNLNFKEIVAYSLLIGGITGNLLDRIIFGGVYDYIGVIIGTYYWPIFNLADIGIVVGILIIIFLELRDGINGNSSYRR